MRERFRPARYSTPRCELPNGEISDKSPFDGPVPNAQIASWCFPDLWKVVRHLSEVPGSPWKVGRHPSGRFQTASGSFRKSSARAQKLSGCFRNPSGCNSYPSSFNS